MYKIKEFSKITKLTVKALRYYDQENILIPSYRDEESQYRYYDENDFKRAEAILLLRSLDFSIAEIKDVLVSLDNAADLSYYLEEKKTMIADRINLEKELIRKIDLYMNPKEREDISMNYEIVVKEFQPITVVSIRYKGKYSDVGKYIGRLYKAAGGNASGAPFNCYYDEEFKEEADIELCVPTKKLISAGEINGKELPRIKAICTTHIGSYESINLAYKAILDHAAKHNLKCLTPSREVYIKGPGMIFKGNPNKYVTQIIIPFEGEGKL